MSATFGDAGSPTTANRSHASCPSSQHPAAADHSAQRLRFAPLAPARPSRTPVSALTAAAVHATFQHNVADAPAALARIAATATAPDARTYRDVPLDAFAPTKSLTKSVIVRAAITHKPLWTHKPVQRASARIEQRCEADISGSPQIRRTNPPSMAVTPREAQDRRDERLGGTTSPAGLSAASSCQSGRCSASSPARPGGADGQRPPRGGELRRLAAQAGVRRRFAAHELRHAHAIEMAHEGIPLPIIQRQPGHAHLGITSIYLQGSTLRRSSTPFITSGHP